VINKVSLTRGVINKKKMGKHKKYIVPISEMEQIGGKQMSETKTESYDAYRVQLEKIKLVKNEMLEQRDLAKEHMREYSAAKKNERQLMTKLMGMI
jgi:hypothetical protein